MKLLSIIQKNFRIFLRSKVSALIIFLGPLLLVSLVGMSFSSTQLPGLTVGVFSPTYNEFTNSIVQKISENQFSVKKFTTQLSCSDAVKKGDASICLLFPENMDKTNNEVTFVVDYSKLNLVWIVVDIFSNKVSERATELRYNYATDLLSRVTQTKDDITKTKDQLSQASSKQSSAKDMLKSTSDSLATIDPHPDLGMVTTPSDARTIVDSIRSSVSDARSRVDSAKSKVSGSSLSQTEQDAINSELDSVDSALVSTNQYLKGNSSIKSLGYIIDDLENGITNAQLQLSAIKTKKAEAAGGLVALDGTLAEVSSNVASLQTLADTISSRLDAVQESDAEQLVSPIKTKIEPVSTPETHFNYLFPTLIVLIIMITAILLSSTLVMTEKRSKSVFRNFITPTSDFLFNTGTFLTALLAILGQLVIFLFVSWLFFETDVVATLGPSLIVLTLVISVFTLLGMLIGYLFKSEETYVLASVSISTLMLMLSSTIMPIESISTSIRVFASYTPFVISEHILRQVMFFKFSLSTMLPEIGILVGYAAVFVGAIFILHKAFRYTIAFKKKEKTGK